MNTSTLRPHPSPTEDLAWLCTGLSLSCWREWAEFWQRFHCCLIRQREESLPRCCSLYVNFLKGSQHLVKKALSAFYRCRSSTGYGAVKIIQ